MALRLVTSLLASALLIGALSGTASATAETRGGHYVAAQTPLVIWCDSESTAPWLPEIPDPNWLVPGPNDWLNEEPECAPADVANDLREAQGKERTAWGYSGFIWTLPPANLGQWVSVEAADELGNHPPLRVITHSDSGEDSTAEGCGPQRIVVPADAPPHWTSEVDDPKYLLVAHVDNMMLLDDLSLCLGSTGWIEATYQV